MRYSLKNQRAVVGHDITVKVTASAKESIAKVTTELDGRRLARDVLTPPEAQYERIFRHVGGGGPGQEHVLVLRVTTGDGVRSLASRRWNDVS